MRELVKMINKKIANEQGIVDREAAEVTVDWVAVQAEVRLKAFQEVKESLDRRLLHTSPSS